MSRNGSRLVLVSNETVVWRWYGRSIDKFDKFDKSTQIRHFGKMADWLGHFTNKRLQAIDRGFDTRPGRLLNRGAVACVWVSYSTCPRDRGFDSLIEQEFIDYQAFLCTDLGPWSKASI